MPSPELKNKVKLKEDNSGLKGTLASVFVLGAIIAITWISVYFLFLERL